MKLEKQICLSLPDKLFQQVKDAAEQDYTTVTGLIRQAVVKYLRDREREILKNPNE